MQYHVTVPFGGNAARAFDMAVASLTMLGFQIAAKDSAALEFVGPGMKSTRQSALLGASRIRIEAGADSLSLDAELGGVASMARFIALFPAGLCLFLFAIGVGIASITAPQHLVMIAAIAAASVAINIVIWLVLAPILTRYIKGRSCRAVDALLKNMAVVGREA
jgi:hypothetical protein